MEKERLEEDRLGKKDWRFFGPYLSDRQWGTVREDYSPHGTAWDYFPHDHARSRAYRWGEDGLAGFSDAKARLCLSLAVWNENDPILKERLFGLTNEEGNHGEDVKELYYFLDASPTHSYLKMLYKYPQKAYPYDHIVAENKKRTQKQPEYEVYDTGCFAENRYFDVFVEYAKQDTNDILMRVTVCNRGPETAKIHVLPQLWFRNTWSWFLNALKPTVRATGPNTISANHVELGNYFGYYDGQPQLLFCENETNPRRLFELERSPGYFKDAFHDYLLHGRKDAVNPNHVGTKVAAHYSLSIPPGGQETIRLRLANKELGKPFDKFEGIFEKRIADTNEFYGEIQKDLSSEDARLVQRQAFAGLIWSKQYFGYDVTRWLNGDPAQLPPPPERKLGRNRDWTHLRNFDVISMPDKWEYPWYAAWDLAFHMLPFALLDPEFAKQQLLLFTLERYMHPNGQLPAYEWAFGDVNPPVHAWAAWRVFQIDRKNHDGAGDLDFLERIFHKLMLNFTWWVNRKDTEGRNVFQGGFLGLDNIGVFDRSAPLPTGGFINQSDGTAWMAMYCLNMMRIALELALNNPVYEDMATKFFEHFLQIADAMTNLTGLRKDSLWDEQDEFYYDELNLPDKRMIKLRVRSMVGLIPLFAVETLEPGMRQKLPRFNQRLHEFFEARPDLAFLISRWNEPGIGDRGLLSLLRGHRLKRILKRMLDETEFLSDHGIRALSRYHKDHPYTFECQGTELTVQYQPAESESGLFGGNSNWRGPVWFPVNYLIVESLQKFHHYYGEDFRVECPTGSGKFLSLEEIAQEIGDRLTRLFLRDSEGRRPVFGDNPQFNSDPQFCNYPLFYEYFDGDTGRGVGAAHQTGWTALVAKLLQPRRRDTEGAENELHQVETPENKPKAKDKSTKGSKAKKSTRGK
ncbi:glucosidase [Telmatocola sphagniphila]|uniref:Glucosidase n=1 Tax=Telmatocola sphagniphila TaxID=1123043 RepID=A0A8E6BC18_9BACT|nr:glucosidase [Telmatocola sphagniphila]